LKKGVPRKVRSPFRGGIEKNEWRVPKKRELLRRRRNSLRSVKTVGKEMVSISQRGPGNESHCQHFGAECFGEKRPDVASKREEYGRSPGSEQPGNARRETAINRRGRLGGKRQSCTWKGLWGSERRRKREMSNTCGAKHAEQGLRRSRSKTSQLRGNSGVSAGVLNAEKKKEEPEIGK